MLFAGTIYNSPVIYWWLFVWSLPNLQFHQERFLRDSLWSLGTNFSTILKGSLPSFTTNSALVVSSNSHVMMSIRHWTSSSIFCVPIRSESRKSEFLADYYRGALFVWYQRKVVWKIWVTKMKVMKWTPLTQTDQMLSLDGTNNSISSYSNLIRTMWQPRLWMVIINTMQENTVCKKPRKVWYSLVSHRFFISIWWDSNMIRWRIVQSNSTTGYYFIYHILQCSIHYFIEIIFFWFRLITWVI